MRKKRIRLIYLLREKRKSLNNRNLRRSWSKHLQRSFHKKTLIMSLYVKKLIIETS